MVHCGGITVAYNLLTIRFKCRGWSLDCFAHQLQLQMGHRQRGPLLITRWISIQADRLTRPLHSWTEGHGHRVTRMTAGGSHQAALEPMLWLKCHRLSGRDPNTHPVYCLPYLANQDIVPPSVVQSGQFVMRVSFLGVSQYNLGEKPYSQYINSMTVRKGGSMTQNRLSLLTTAFAVHSNAEVWWNLGQWFQ